jgi:hypothetical protein
LVDLGLVAIQRGSGTRGSSFHMCLARHSGIAPRYQTDNDPNYAVLSSISRASI